MTETPRDALARIEAAIEQGGLAEARQLIEDAESRFGPRPELAELRRRLTVVESALSGRGQIDAAVRRAREETSRANYPGALAAIESALRLAPGDPALAELLDQTTRAALRHESVVERNVAAAAVAERIAAQLDRGDLETAADELREANLQFGRHDKLLELQRRFDALWKQAELEKTVAFADQARAFLDGRNWTAALQQAERILRLDPKNPEALELKRRARVEIEGEEARRQAELDVERAQQDVERLIHADELPRAAHALQQAVDRLGRHPAFDEIARRLDQAKAGLQARKRLDWTQRRLKEADDLVRQAGRLSLQGKYEQAIERLETARDLHPEHPEVEGLLRAAQSSRERTLAERHRGEALAAAKAEVRQLLDALRLDEAQTRLRAAEARYGGDDPQLRALATRLARLKEAEHPAAEPPPSLDDSAAAQALARQRELAAAYSWKQALLFPFRGGGTAAVWTLVGLAVALDALAAVPRIGVVFAALRWLLPAAALGWCLEIVRETLRGKNLLPPWSALFDPRPWASDLALALGVALVAAAPLAAFALTRGFHALWGAATGWGAPAGWWVAAVLGWGGTAFAVAAWGAAGAFGFGQTLRLPQHLRAVRAGEPDALLPINLVFAVVVAIVILRAALLPAVPWLGSPLAGGLEAWGLLAAPHLIGVALRRHRIELEGTYNRR